MKKTEKNIILFAGNLPDRHVESIKRLEKKLHTKYRIVVMIEPGIKILLKAPALKKVYKIIRCDVTNIEEIRNKIEPMKDEITTIIFVYEKFAGLYRHLTSILNLENNSSLEAIRNCTDKIEMRKAFFAYDPSITPKFIMVKDASSIGSIEKEIGYPVILKPVHLSKSRLVTVSNNRQQLEENLSHTLKVIGKVYESDHVKFDPLILAEEMMAGKMYTVDAYIDDSNNVFFTPIVSIITGKDLGVDDFYNYARIVPTDLSESEISAANEVVRKGMVALGLKRNIGHVELMRTSQGWKIIEIGSRIGGYRTKMLKLSYGIDHIENLLLVKLGEKPVIKNELLAHTVVLELFPDAEGCLDVIHGIKKLRTLKSLYEMKRQKKAGEFVGFSRNGNLCVMYIILSHKDKKALDSDLEEVKKIVKIETHPQYNPL